jgi:hypothetical protein
MAQWYRQGQLRAYSGAINWATDNIVATLHTSSYTPNLDTDAFVSNLSSEVSTGNGYTTGGIALTGKSVTYTPANSWSAQWAPVTQYFLGQTVRPLTANGFVYTCIVAGTSGASAPSFPAYGLSVSDGTVTWLACGAGMLSWLASNIVWSGFSATFRYVVISDRQSGVPATEPLMGFLDTGTNTTGQGGNFDLNWVPAVLSIAVP